MHADGSDELARRNWETVTHIDHDVTERAACQGECACAQMRIRLGAGLENLMDEAIEILTATRPQKSQPSNTWDHWPSWEEESVSAGPHA